MPIYIDGQEYPDELSYEAANHPAIPPELKRVYIVSKSGGEVEDRTSDTTMTVEGPSPFEQRFGVSPQEFFFDYPRAKHTNNPLAKDLGYNEIKKPDALDTLEFINTVENYNNPWKGGVSPTSSELKTMDEKLKKIEPPEPPQGTFNFMSSRDKSYDTSLTESEEKQFQEWKQKYAPKDSGEDYDFRGAFKAGATPDPATNHWVDTFKKPNHPTFSNQSQYAKDRPDLAGSWDGETYIPPPSRMPLGSTEKPAGEFKSKEATTLPVTFSDAPEPSQKVRSTASPLINISDEDIKNAIDVGMGAGPGTIVGMGSKIAVTAANAKNWYRGSDGKMRYEISDLGMKLKDKDWTFGQTGKLPEFIEHPELFKAYPELADINFKVAEKGYKYIGSYNARSKTLTVNTDAIKAGDSGILDVLAHEIQHIVQAREGFSLGSNPSHSASQALTALAEKIYSMAPGKEKLKLQDLYFEMRDKIKEFGEYMYLRAPGEIEANSVAARRQLTDKQRELFPVKEMEKMLEGEVNTLHGGKYLPEFNYP